MKYRSIFVYFVLQVEHTIYDYMDANGMHLNIRASVFKESFTEYTICEDKIENQVLFLLKNQQ